MGLTQLGISRTVIMPFLRWGGCPTCLGIHLAFLTNG